MLKDAVSIPGIFMTYVLSKALKMKKPGDPDLHPQVNLASINVTKNTSEKIVNELEWIAHNAGNQTL